MKLARHEGRISGGGLGRGGGVLGQEWLELQEVHGKSGGGRGGDCVSDPQEAWSELRRPVDSSSKDQSGTCGLQTSPSLSPQNARWALGNTHLSELAFQASTHCAYSRVS